VNGSYANYTLGRIQLPNIDVDLAASNAVVRISIQGGTSIPANAFSLDEGWLFNTSIGALTVVNCGTAAPASGGSANRVFMEPPTVTTPRPTIRIGFASDRSDSYFPAATASGLGFLSAWQMPTFTPPLTNVFTVTSNALDASVTLRYFQRWHTNAGS